MYDKIHYKLKKKKKVDKWNFVSVLLNLNQEEKGKLL